MKKIKEWRERMYRASFKHPLLDVPMLMYFDDELKLVSFVKDEEKLPYWMTDETMQEEREKRLKKIKNMVKFNYSIHTIEEAYQFLEEMGVDTRKVKFHKILIN